MLKGLRASDSGAYTCVAHNPAGEDARLHTVNVLGETYLLVAEVWVWVPPPSPGPSLPLFSLFCLQFPPPLGRLAQGPW